MEGMESPAEGVAKQCWYSDVKVTLTCEQHWATLLLQFAPAQLASALVPDFGTGVGALPKSLSLRYIHYDK